MSWLNEIGELQEKYINTQKLDAYCKNLLSHTLTGVWFFFHNIHKALSNFIWIELVIFLCM